MPLVFPRRRRKNSSQTEDTLPLEISYCSSSTNEDELNQESFEVTSRKHSTTNHHTTTIGEQSTTDEQETPFSTTSSSSSSESQYSLLTSLVCLCCLESPNTSCTASSQQMMMTRVISMGSLLVPSQERMVRDGLRRHIELCLWLDNNGKCNTNNKNTTTSDDDASHDGNPTKIDATFIKHMNTATAESFARDSLRQDDYMGAIRIFKLLLEAQTNSPRRQARTHSQLAVLCCAVGRNQLALAYSTQAYQWQQQQNEPHAPLPAAIRAMEIGMVHFGGMRVAKALKAWREAMQLACLAVGYEHSIVAILLGNLGVLHYESGDLPACILALEESVELQRAILRANASDAEHGIYKLATTMGNLAMVLERNKQYDKAIGLLDDSLAMLGSIDAPVIKEMEDIMSFNLSRIVKKRDKTVLFFQPSLEERSSADGSVDSARSSILFGNSDGIPDRRVAAKLSMVESDNHDFVLLGPLDPELTPELRVRETVLTWFGKKKLDDSISFVSFDDELSSERDKEAIPCDLDAGFVLDAELHLRQIHLQAMRHLDLFEIDDALDLFDSALRSHQAKFGDKHHLVGNALHNMGMIHMFAKQYDAAHDVFSRAVRVRSAALGPDHPDVQASLMKIGLIRLACGDNESALRIFRGIRDKFLLVLGYGHPQMAKILNNIGVIACEVGDYSSAHKAFTIAYEYQRSRAEDMTEDSVSVQRLLFSLL
jgi:tetratricopeptide (TPR) repeat protein